MDSDGGNDGIEQDGTAAVCSKSNAAAKKIASFSRGKWFEENDPEGVAFEYKVLE